MKKSIFIIALFIFFICVYMFRVEVLEEVTPKIAQRFGIKIDTIEFSKIEFNEIAIKKFHAKYEDNFKQANIVFNDMLVTYDFLEDQQNIVKNISVDQMHLEVNSNAEEDTEEESVNSILANIPLIGVEVAQLNVKYKVEGELLLQFVGAISHGDEFNLKGNISSKAVPNSDVYVSLSDSIFKLNVEVTDLEKPVINWEGNYYIEDDWLTMQMQGSVGLTVINEYLVPFGVQKYVVQDTSSIEAEVEADLAETPQQLLESLLVHVDIDSSMNLNVEDSGIQHTKLDLRTNCILKGSNTVNCYFKHPQYAEIEFADLPLWLEGYFSKTEKNYVVEINPNSELSIQYINSDDPQIVANGGARLHIRAESLPLKFDSSIPEFEFAGWINGWQFNGAYEFVIDVKNIKQPIHMDRLIVKDQGNVKITNKQLQLSSALGMNVTALKPSYDMSTASKLELIQVGNLNLDYNFDRSRLNAKELRFSLMSKDMRYGDYKIFHSPFYMDLSKVGYEASKWDFEGSIKSENFSVSEQDVEFSLIDLNSNMKFENNNIVATGDLNIKEVDGLVNFSVQHDVLQESGQGYFEVNKIALADNEFILQKISDSGFPLQLNAGDLDIDATVKWDESMQLLTKLSVNEASGDYAQNQFNNVNADFEFVKNQGWQLSRPTTISVASLNLGVPINDISIALEKVEYAIQAQPSIRVGEFSASVLEGSLYSKEIDIDLNQSHNAFSVYLSALSLEKLLALNQTKDLVASGKFDGELPIELKDGELVINKGWLRADEHGGYIKYGNIKQVLVGNENLKLVGQLLEDFQYNEMSAQVDLNPDGGLFLATKLHGRSPKAEINKQVNLNFNIEFNLWKFLESARLLTRIDQDITEQIISKQKE